MTLIAGGKSMGGRMTSQALAKQHDERVAGIAFVGFPLHQPNKPSLTRAEHLKAVQLPMLFLQGTRDTLADLELMKQVHTGLRADAILHIIEGADHSFAVLKRTGRTNEQVQDELATTIASWAARL
jgi:predicted alpha/beta-hydrolase family hydrolase